MTAIKKILAQAFPETGERLDLYRVADGSRAEIALMAIANQTPEDLLFEATLAVGGEAHSPKQVLLPQIEVPARSLYAFAPPEAIPLNSGDVVRILCPANSFSVHLIGTEVPK